MNRSFQFFLWTALLLVIATPLHAQTGCTDSPENPTVVLSLVGAAGWLIASARTRFSGRR